MTVLNCIRLQHIFITFISVKTENPIVNVIISCGNLKIFVAHPSQLSKIGYQLDKVKLTIMVNIYYKNIQLITHILHFFAQPVITFRSCKVDVGIIQLRSHFKETVATLIKTTHLDSFSLFSFADFTQCSFNKVIELRCQYSTQMKCFLNRSYSWLP